MQTRSQSSQNVTDESSNVKFGILLEKESILFGIKLAEMYEAKLSNQPEEN